MQAIFDGLCFIETQTKDYARLEILKPECNPVANDSCKTALCFLLGTDDGLLANFQENYYYHLQVHDREMEGSLKFAVDTLPEFIEALTYLDCKPTVESEFLWFKFQYDFGTTLALKRIVREEVVTIKRIEKLYYSLLRASEQADIYGYVEWNDRLRTVRSLVSGSFDQGTVDQGTADVLRILKVVNPFFKTDKWEQAHSAKLLEDLVDVDRASDAQTLSQAFTRITSLPGIGVSSMSLILHSLWPDKYAIFSSPFADYLTWLGLIKSNHWGHASKYQMALFYYDYQDALSRIITLIFGGWERTPDYLAISYWLKKTPVYGVI